eukprot:1590377-Alexandrium_andersonii.AAC.1
MSSGKAALRARSRPPRGGLRRTLPTDQLQAPGRGARPKGKPPSRSSGGRLPRGQPVGPAGRAAGCGMGRTRTKPPGGGWSWPR